MDIINPILNIVLGILLLTTGKKLYWLFVAIVGFVIGLALASQMGLTPQWMNYLVAFGVGVIGAILATFLQKLAIALVGFVVGGYGSFYLANTLLGIKSETTSWIAFFIGGIVGLLLVASVFNWALYLLSSWAGATLVTRTVTEGVKLDPTFGLVVFFVLFGLFRDQPKQKPTQVKPEIPPTKEKD
jgi:MFS family permease